MFDMFDYASEVEQWLQAERAKQQRNSRHKKPFIGSRGYPHFDVPISLNDNLAIAKLSTSMSNSQAVSKWPFFPFLTNYQRVRKFRHKPCADDDTESTSPFSHRDQKKNTHIKSRPVMMAAHRDSCLLSFFSFLLSDRYEEAAKKLSISENVLAYRSLGGKNNVDFAKKAFDYMQSVDVYSCLLVDLKGFFDNIDHEILYDAVERVIAQGPLGADISHILKNVTQYRYVNEDNLIHEIKRLKKSFHVKVPGLGRYRRICKVEDFNKYIDNPGFIKTNRTNRGIPQGSPVSGVLANVFLMEFDAWVNNRLSAYSVKLYQRYSDDILIVCPPNEIESLYDDIQQRLRQFKVKASVAKTEAFIGRQGVITNIVGNLEPAASKGRQSIQYLGLEWNGQQIVLRPSTVGKRFRPKHQLSPKFWKYNRSTIDKISDSKPLRRQFSRVRKTIRVGAKSSDTNVSRMKTVED